MIGKVASSGRDFKGVIDYLINGRRGSDPHPNRVAWVETRNMLVDEPRLAARLMRATAARSVRCKAPVYHFLVSWRRDEAPSDAMMREVADTTCLDLGLEDYQRILVAHDDTEHRHVHVVVNRIHPEKGKAWNRRQDFVRIEQSLRRQSEALGLPMVHGRHMEDASCKTSDVEVTEVSSRPLVSEMDVLIALYRMGLAKRAEIEALTEECHRRRAEAPVAVQVEREMREALRSAFYRSGERLRKKVMPQQGRGRG